MNQDIGHVSKWAYMYSIVAQMEAIKAEVEAMRVANQERRDMRDSIAHSDAEFYGCANQLRECAVLLAQIF